MSSPHHHDCCGAFYSYLTAVNSINSQIVISESISLLNKLPIAKTKWPITPPPNRSNACVALARVRGDHAHPIRLRCSTELVHSGLHVNRDLYRRHSPRVVDHQRLLATLPHRLDPALDGRARHHRHSQLRRRSIHSTQELPTRDE